MTVIVLTSGSSWTVPADWNSSNNTVEAIGGGAGGDNWGYGAGGGGGAYAKIANLTLTPSSTVSFSVGGGGAANTDGSDTWFNSVATLLAKAGKHSASASGGAGGLASECVGTVAYSGGSGGNASNYGSSGGGGAGGPNGSGANGGSGSAGPEYAGGGGGGAGGGVAGGNAVLTTGGIGGANWYGSGAGAAGSSSDGGAGSLGGGGGGSGTPSYDGGAGGAGTEWASYGAGGGGGGGYNVGGSGGLYGGGGGGGATPASGAQGIIVITYTPATATYEIGAERGSFVVTGNPATLGVYYTLTALTGSLALSGIDAFIARSYLIDALAGSLNLTGNNATLQTNVGAAAEFGALSVVGGMAELKIIGPSGEILEEVQKFDIDAVVDLYTLDLTPYGGPVMRWTPSRPFDGAPCVWDGDTYESVDITIDGMEMATQGTSPRPRVSIGNVNNEVGAMLVAYDDALGCRVTFTRTLLKYLDGQPNADTTQHFPTEVYRIERVVSMDKDKVAIELAAPSELIGFNIPRNVMLRSTCMFRYRVWNGSAFDYSNATCPYTGAACFLPNGTGTPDQSKDACGKKLTDCKNRFGETAELPYGAFPGLGRYE